MSLLAMLSTGEGTPIVQPPGTDWTLYDPPWPTLDPGGTDPLVRAAGASFDLSGEVRLVVDGNSIMTGAYSPVGPFSAEVAAQPGMADVIDAHKTVAIGGVDWETIKDTSDVRAFYSPGATNILFVCENRNAVVMGRAAGRPLAEMTNAADMAEYVKGDVRAYLTDLRSTGQAWHVIFGSSFPTGGMDGNPEYELQSDAIHLLDEWQENNVDELGLTAFIRWTNWQEFNHTGKTRAAFDAHLDVWQEQAPRFTHIKNRGKTLAATNVADGILRLGGLPGYGAEAMQIGDGS